MTIRITLPIKTVSEANARGHWAKGAARAKEQRSVTRAMVHGGRYRAGYLIPWAVAVPLLVILTRVAPRSLDGDNLQRAFKAVRDGVADAFGANDNDPRIEWRYEQRRGKPKEYAVEIVIEPKEGG